MTSWSAETNPDVLSETALAKAQALICQAARGSGLDDAVLGQQIGKTPRQIRLMLTSKADPSVKHVAQVLAVCGYRLTMNIEKLPDTDRASTADAAGKPAAKATDSGKQRGDAHKFNSFRDYARWKQNDGERSR